MMKPMLHAPKAGEKVDIEIRHYGEKPGKYLLYDDDGETFDYEKDHLHGVHILLKKLKEHGKELYRLLKMVNRIR
jgi:alpha-D-xyloside xylohydrolase